MRLVAGLVAAWLVFGPVSVKQLFAWQSDTVERLLTRLTSHAWDNNAPGALGHTEKLLLRRDGSYRWKRDSDYTERDQAGSWNLVAHGPTAGLLRLAETGDVPFRFEGEQLRTAISAFSRGDAIAYDERQRKLTAADLPKVAAGPWFTKVASTAWVKTNSFDDFRLADRLEFSADGRYRASYRGGQCVSRGLWGLEYQRHETIQFISLHDDNECDQRGGSAGLTHDQLNFAGELLLLGASYAPEDHRPSKNVFVFDRYGRTLQTRGEYSGTLRSGRAVVIEITHASASGETLQMNSLEIGFQKSRIVPRGGEADGPVRWVLRKDLAGKSVGPGATLRYTVEVTPPFAGDAAFVIVPRFANASQTFDAAQSYQTTIGE